MKTVLILGASRGIGFEFARQYVADGWRVLATARDDEGCAKLQAVGAETFKLDVAKPASVSGLSWRLDGEKIDVALYVAGVMDRASPQTPPTQQRKSAGRPPVRSATGEAARTGGGGWRSTLCHLPRRDLARNGGNAADDDSRAWSHRRGRLPQAGGIWASLSGGHWPIR